MKKSEVFIADSMEKLELFTKALVAEKNVQLSKKEENQLAFSAENNNEVNSNNDPNTNKRIILFSKAEIK